MKLKTTCYNISNNISDETKEKPCINIQTEHIYKHKILEIISDILNIILNSLCKRIYNNNFLQHPLFVKKNICEIIIKYNKFDNNDIYNKIMDKISHIISNLVCYINFHQYKIYYTWENIQDIIKNI